MTKCRFVSLKHTQYIPIHVQAEKMIPIWLVVVPNGPSTALSNAERWLSKR